MKLKRKNGLTVGIIALSAVAITSVGFASWVISAGDKAEVTGNILVDDVKTANHDVVGVWDAGATGKISAGASTQAIKFGSNKNKYGLAGTSTTSGEDASWLRNNDASSFESLTATYYAQIKNTTNALSLTSVKLEIKNADTPKGINDAKKFVKEDTSTVDYATTGWAGALALKLITKPTTISVTKATAGEIADFTGKGAEEGVDYDWLKITFTFGWGALFSNGNPYDYYNAMNASSTINKLDGYPVDIGSLTASKHAEQFLTALDNLLDGVTFKLTIKTYGDASEKSTDQSTFNTQASGYVDVVTVAA